MLDLSGRRVRTLHSGTAQAGTLQLSWDGVDAGGHVAPAGLYFVRASGVGETAEARVVRVSSGQISRQLPRASCGRYGAIDTAARTVACSV